ncbi:MAG TPA: PIN domain nuclease [Acidimicrobiales bacterium]|nr:PIN domain nuclease [Acidimicrobiales bacterium]
MSFVIDTSVVTRLRVPAVRQRVQALDGAGLARTAMTDLEVGFSARNGDEWDGLMSALEAFELMDVDARHFVRARQVQRLLAVQGLKGRKVPDLLIAAVAEATDRTVLHYDADFDHIASVTGQTTEWIVPPGTID